MFKRYTLSCTYFPTQSFARPVVIILYFLCLERKITLPSTSIIRWKTKRGIHTEEVNLLDFKEWHELPSWYPIFQLPYQIDAKVTCTGFYVYIEIIYIDSSPDPDHFASYVYNEPSDEFIRHLYDGIGKANYISND